MDDTAESVVIADRGSPGPSSATRSVTADGAGKGNRRKACDECKQQKVEALETLDIGHGSKLRFYV
jgi:hypothetical protein